eukprot:jgi/Psemu1/60759/gm1.60759_g
MAHNGILTQHGRKSGGKTLQNNKTITTTANVATTTTVEDILPKRSSNDPIIRQEKTQTLHTTPSDATQSILSDDSDNNASNSSADSQVRISNKNRVSINCLFHREKRHGPKQQRKKLMEQSELFDNMMKMIESKKKNEVEGAVLWEKVPPVKSLQDCADAEQVSTLSTRELNLTTNYIKLRDHIKNKWYSIMKFPVNETVSLKMLRKAFEFKMVGVLQNISDTAFSSVAAKNGCWKKKTGAKASEKHRMIKDCRRNNQGLKLNSRLTTIFALGGRYIAQPEFDDEKGLVPISLPGSVGFADDGIMSADYRKYGSVGNEDFYCLVTRILSVINPANNNFKQRKDKDLISNIFSVKDEAFGLTVI